MYTYIYILYNIYIYIYKCLWVHTCMWPRCETCCQRSGLVPISGTMDGARSASGWGKLTVDFVDQNPGIAGRKPMVCVSSLVVFVVWNWFFVTDDGSRSVACLFLGELLVFRCASEGLLPSTSSDIWSLGCLMVSWPQSDCVGLRLPGVDWSVG